LRERAEDMEISGERLETLIWGRRMAGKKRKDPKKSPKRPMGHAGRWGEIERGKRRRKGKKRDAAKRELKRAKRWF